MERMFSVFERSVRAMLQEWADELTAIAEVIDKNDFSDMKKVQLRERIATIERLKSNLSELLPPDVKEENLADVVREWDEQGGRARFGDLGSPETTRDLVSVILTRVVDSLPMTRLEDVKSDLEAVASKVMALWPPDGTA